MQVYQSRNKGGGGSSNPFENYPFKWIGLELTPFDNSFMDFYELWNTSQINDLYIDFLPTKTDFTEGFALKTDNEINTENFPQNFTHILCHVYHGYEKQTQIEGVFANNQELHFFYDNPPDAVELNSMKIHIELKLIRAGA